VHLWSPATEAGTIAVIDWCLHVSSGSLFQIMFPLWLCLRIFGFVQHENMDVHKFPYEWGRLGIGQLLEILCLLLNSSTSMLWSNFSTQPHQGFNLLPLI